jgi:hypothetical protein
VGAVFLATGVAAFAATSRWDDSRTGAVVVGGLGLPLLAVGLDMALTKTTGQRTLDTFESELARPGVDRAAVVAHLESNLDDLARHERRRARIMAGYMGAVAAVVGAAAAINAAQGGTGRQPAAMAAGFGSAALCGIVAWRILESEMPTERLLRLYRADPDLGLRLNVAPTVPVAGNNTGAMVSVSGHF